jgi:hypothetical protein
VKLPAPFKPPVETKVSRLNKKIMRTQKHLFPSLLIGITVTLFALSTGCKKDENDNEDFKTTAEDIGQSESVSSDVDNITSEFAKSGTFSIECSQNQTYDQFNLSTCAVVTNDSINHILTIDFGTGCVGHDGKTRSGKLIVTYNGTGYFDAGSSWVVTFDNFHVGNRHVEGTRSVVNNGLNGSGNMTWTINAQNMKITRADGSWRSWNSLRTRELVSGYGDNTWTNDIYVINGTTTGTNSNGESVSCTLSNITRDHSCHYITSGIIAVTPSNRPMRSIDFGTGTCDDIATVTKNGNSRTIQLRF